jgi:hypothetical protein
MLGIVSLHVGVGSYQPIRATPIQSRRSECASEFSRHPDADECGGTSRGTQLYAHVLNGFNFTALTGLSGSAPVALGLALIDQFVQCVPRRPRPGT